MTVNFKGAMLLATCAAAMASASSANATVFIATQLNSGSKITQVSGPTTAVYSGMVGDYFINAASGAVGVSPVLLNSILLLTKVSTTANTLDIWVTETGLTNLTGTFPSSFTENVMPTGWTVTESTYYSTTNALYAGTLIASDTFTVADVSTIAGPAVSLTGPFSVTHRYSISAATTGSTLSTITLQVAPVVPEPATWAMMIGGFALAGAALRRRTTVSFA